MATGAIIARIITQYSAAGTKAAKKDIVSLGKDFDHFAKKVTLAFGVAAAAGVAFATKIGIDGVKAALADQQAQALLTNTLKNTTHATNAQIDSTEAWIKKTQGATGVLEGELRPALAKFLGVTHNIAKAQGLLGIAMDVSAGSGKDLGAVTVAMMRASTGNLGALTRTGIVLDKATLKSKDYGKALTALEKIYGGATAAKANTFQMRITRIGIAFDEAKKSLGYALLPTLEKFFKTLITKIIPAIQSWIDLNGKKIVAAFELAIKAVVGFGYVVFKVFDFVTRNKNVFVSLGVILGSIWAAAKVFAFVMVLGKVVTAFKAIRAIAISAGIAEAIATGGVSVAAAAAGALAFGAALTIAMLASNKLTNMMDKASTAATGLKLDFKGLGMSTADYNKLLGTTTAGLGGTTAASVKLTKQQIALLAAQKALAKFGLTPTKNTGIADLDPTQIEAVRLNLVKQQTLAKQALNQEALDALALQLKQNVAVQRYSDILAALADNQISTEEVSVLSAKWGMTSGAVLEYIARIYAANDTPSNDAAILKLYMAWGMTKDQAQKYIDFAKALADEKLSTTEIDNLQTKWGMTRQQVLDYAKLVQTGTMFSDSWAAAGDSAAAAWLAALNGAVAYSQFVGSGGLGAAPQTGSRFTGGVPVGSPTGVPHGALDPSLLDGGPGSGFTASITALTDPSGGSVNPSSFSGGTSPGVPNVQVTVQGSVITAADLANTLRNALLTGQLSGNRISLGTEF